MRSLLVIMGVSVVGIGLIMYLLSAGRGRRRTGIPRPTVLDILPLVVFSLTVLACAILAWGGPELRRELARRRHVATATQQTRAVVESHRCQPAVTGVDALAYRFTAPDPVTGIAQIYHHQETLTSPGRGICTPHSTPYERTIWYDPANPQIATIRPVTSSDLDVPLILFSILTGCFGVLPLSMAMVALWQMVALKRPAMQQARTDAAWMEAQGFMIARAPQVVAAARAAQMGPYVRAYHGQLYVSLDFIDDVDERATAWNALWRVQAQSWQNTTDHRIVSKILDRLPRGEEITETTSAPP
jgi:hypothetical protein